MVLACRNIEKGLEAKKYILTRTKSVKPKIFIKHLDLTSFNSIIRFSDTINAEFKEIYALVNNAAVFYHPQGLTEDGYEITFQTNYLGINNLKCLVNSTLKLLFFYIGPFVLTHQLLKVLKRAVHARVVNVSSEAHRNVNVYDLKAVTTCQTEFRSHYVAYGVSKLAINLFTKHLAKKLARKYTKLGCTIAVEIKNFLIV